MSSSSPTRHAVVIGAGIVGVCCAYELWRDGYRVTLVEHASPGGEQAASYGNGAWLSPSSVVPMSMPGLWKKIPGYLFNADSPLRLRWWAKGAEVAPVHGRLEISGTPGDLVTLLAVGGPAAGVTTAGLRWPLLGATLAPGSTRGVSNELAAGTALISVAAGVLVAIHTPRQP